MTRWPTSTWLWFGVHVALLGSGILLWVSGPSSSDLLARATPRLSPLPTLPVLSSPPIDYGRLRDQAVFYASRAYVAPPSPGETGPTHPDYQFVAAMLMPKDQSVAFVRHAGETATRKVRLHDNLDGWQVMLIERQRIVIELNGARFDIASESTAAVPGITRVTLSSLPAPVQATGIRVLGMASTPLPIANPTAARQETTARVYRPPQLTQ